MDRRSSDAPGDADEFRPHAVPSGDEEPVLVIEPRALLPTEPALIPEEALALPSRRGSARRLRWAMLVLLCAGGAGIGLWSWWAGSAAAPHYKTAPVDRGPVAAVVTATGTVNPVVSVQVGSQVTGKIKTLYADFNSAVTRGQLIAQIDPAPFQSRVNQARASLKNVLGARDKAQAAADQRRLELDRMQRLRQGEFVSQADLDLARTNYRDTQAQLQIAHAQVDQARAALANAELDLGYTRIVSPVDGIVVSRNMDVGQTVVASFQTPTLFVIAQDLTRMQVNANVSESDIGGVAEGKPAEFTVDAYPKERFAGTVVQVRNAPVSIQNVVTYDVVIAVDNRDLKLKPGMTANAAIVTTRKEGVLRVPNAALRFKLPGVPLERKKTEVWVVREGQPPRAVGLRLGVADAAHTEVAEAVEGDLREGDAVIVGVEAVETGRNALPPGFGLGPQMR